MTIRNYIDSIRTSLNIVEREADKRGIADREPTAEQGMALVKMDCEGDELVSIVRYSEAEAGT